MLNIGFIGNGVIATLLTEFCATRPDRYKVVGALTTSHGKPSVGQHPLKDDLTQLLAQKPHLIVECAGHAAVANHAVPILRSGVDLIVVSTGSFADEAVWDAVRAAAGSTSARLRLPAGAAPGIDALAAAKLGGLAQVSLASIKPPLAWAGTAAESHYRLAGIIEPTALFTGNARKAALTFPKNANIAATVALAGVGFERTEVTLMADPAVNQNIHRIEARGAFGELSLEVHANPAPAASKTSYLAALSVMRLLEHETDGIVI